MNVYEWNGGEKCDVCAAEEGMGVVRSYRCAEEDEGCGEKRGGDKEG
jgi:hypothetical protein